jgi:iron(III) transport system substrate-binding protein
MKTVLAALALTLGAAGSVLAQESPQALVDAAKKEGVVVLYAGGHTREGATTVAQQFEKKYGIKVEFTRKGTGEVAKMVEAERQTGNARGDVISVSDRGLTIKWGKEGVLAKHQVPNAAALPKESQDPAGFAVSYSLTPLGVMYNPRTLPTAELPKKWSDLLQPRWKGRIVHADPSYSGTSLTFVNALTRTFGPKFYQELGKNKLLAVQSALAVPQMVLSGEALLGIPAIESLIAVAKEKGEPLGMIYPEDGVVGSGSDLAVLAKAPHPNAARLLVNFHLSDEMQKQFVDQGGRSINPNMPAPKGTPATSALKLLWADVPWLAEHRAEQIKQFEAAVLGK